MWGTFSTCPALASLQPRRGAATFRNESPRPNTMNAPADSQGQLSLETLKRLDAVCAAYESAWQKNNPPRIEEFLGDAGEPERGLIFRELLKLDAELRGKAGLSVATEELRSRFPEYSELITGLESKNIAEDATMPPREG